MRTAFSRTMKAHRAKDRDGLEVEDVYGSTLAVKDFTSTVLNTFDFVFSDAVQYRVEVECRMIVSPFCPMRDTEPSKKIYVSTRDVFDFLHLFSCTKCTHAVSLFGANHSCSMMQVVALTSVAVTSS